MDKFAGDDAPREFGEPLPGEPSIAYTLSRHQLSEIQQRVANTMKMVTDIQGAQGP